MLPKKRRIKRSEFANILSKGKRYNSEHLLLYVSPIDPDGINKESRFSFSVSKKVSKLSVDRNKHRRRGYAVISRYLKDIKSGFFYFFSFKKSSNSIDFSLLEKEIKELLFNSRMLS